MTEADIMETCDLCLLYIEPGVFGELQLKPAMPPPPSTTFVAKSVTEILPDRTDMSKRVGSPLNLCVTHTAVDTSPVQPPIEIDMSTSLAASEPAVNSSATGNNDVNVMSE